MAFSPPINSTNQALPTGISAANESLQYQSPLQAQSTSSHHPNFPYPPSNGGLRRDSNNDSWSGDESNGDHDDGNDDSKKRKRPMSVSCELCKQRKVKCDRGQPTCGWCTRNGQICEYKERKKPGLRAGYGRELEARLDRLEAVITSQQNTLTQLATGALQSAQQDTSQQEANVFANSSLQIHPSLIDRPELPSIKQISSPYTPRTPNMIDLRNNYQGFNGTYGQGTGEPYSKPTLPSLQQQDGQQPYFPNMGSTLSTTNLGDSTPMSNPATQDQDLPPYDLLYTLTDLFFKHVNTWCPILHRRTTFDTLFGPSSLDEAGRILLHAIVATTLRFSTDPRLSAERKESYYHSSKQKVLLYGLENSSVKALQALVILALDLVGTSNGPPSWNILALIARSAVQLGLSIEATSPSVSPRVSSIYTLRAMVLPEPSNWIEDESRRRLFWMIYILDRYATVCTAFEFALDEKEIDRKLPCRDDLFTKNQAVETRWFRSHERAEESGIDRPENLGSFSYYVEIVGFLSQIHQFLRKPVDIGAPSDVEQWQSEYRKLHSGLNAWKNSLPKEYANTTRMLDASGNNKIANCGWIMLHATYHTTVIRLHSSAAYPARRSPIFSPSFRASQCCLASVDAISALCNYVKQNAMLSKLGPPFAFSVWVASRLLLVHCSTIDHNINPTIHLLVSTLRELGIHWSVADRYAALLQRVLDEFAESESNGGATSGNGGRLTPSSVRVLADMRRCAYDLDFLISKQPRLQMIGGAASSGPTPSRTPAPNELEYLDVFDFFNMPRLPIPMNADATVGGSAGNGGGGGGGGSGLQMFGFAGQDSAGPSAQYGDTSGTGTSGFGWDASADWFMGKGD